jgi:hypothetical protein
MAVLSDRRGKWQESSPDGDFAREHFDASGPRRICRNGINLFALITCEQCNDADRPAARPRHDPQIPMFIGNGYQNHCSLPSHWVLHASAIEQAISLILDWAIS